MQTRVLFSLTAALVCAVFTSSTQAQSVYENWFLSQTLTNPTPASSDFFGRAVSGVGTDKVLIGASRDNTGANNAGSAYLYSTDDTLLTTYTNPAPETDDGFGFAVSGVGNDKVLIGAYRDNTGADDAGSAYLYSTDGTLLTTYTNPTPASSDFFGVGVSGVGNDKVLIGAYRDNTGADNAGSAYLYSTDGTLLTTYTNPAPETDDGFGFAVSGVGSDKVLIGADSDDTGADNAGSAYLYSTDGTLLTTYTNPTPETDDYFGYAVSGVGTDKVLIGAIEDNTGADNTGSAYLYSTDGTLLTTYTNPTPETDDFFGLAVSAVGNDKVLIGALADDTGADDAGSAYLYSTNGTLLTTYTNPTPATFDNFGLGVSGVGNDKVLIGAYRDDTGASAAGSAYLYEVLPQLRIDRTPNPDIVRVSWEPASVTDWVLQVTPGLPSTNWVNAPTGTNNPALAPATFPARFYRLNKP